MLNKSGANVSKVHVSGAVILRVQLLEVEHDMQEGGPPF